MAVMTPQGAGPKTGMWTPWLTMGLVAIGAVAAGMLVPQLMPGDKVLDTNRAALEAKNKSKSEYVAPSLPDMPNPQNMLARLACGTFVVLGLSVASIWAMRRWTLMRQPLAAGQRTLRLVESLALGGRCTVHLVYLGKREVLVGVDGGGIKTIVPLAKAFDDVLAEETDGEVGRPAPSGGVREADEGKQQPDATPLA